MSEMVELGEDTYNTIDKLCRIYDCRFVNIESEELSSTLWFSLDIRPVHIAVRDLFGEITEIFVILNGSKRFTKTVDFVIKEMYD